MALSPASKKSALGASVIAAAILIASPFIGDHEGDKLTSYEDVAGVWTVCEGVTGPTIKPGLKMSVQQCNELDQSTIGQFMEKVTSLIKVPVTPETLAAHTSFAYNIGMTGYARSKTLKLTNAGNIVAGCQAMANWETAGGVNCAIKTNGCYGLVQRRNDEIKLCESGKKGK